MRFAAFRKLARPFVAGLTLAVIAVGVTSPAIAGQAWTLKANIPFEFAVNDSTLPAGEYIVTYSHSGLVRIASARGTRSIAALTISRSSRLSPRPDEPSGKLVFSLSGHEYLLSQVWRAGEGHELMQAPATQKKAARRESTEVTTIELASLDQVAE